MTESVDRQTAVLRLRGADDILILCHKTPMAIPSAAPVHCILRSRRWAKRRDFMQRPHPQNV